MAAGPAAVGSQRGCKWFPRKRLTNLSAGCERRLEHNLESVILFGSAVAGDFHPEFSNLNLFCVLRDSSFAALQALAPAAKWWNEQKAAAAPVDDP